MAARILRLQMALIPMLLLLVVPYLLSLLLNPGLLHQFARLPAECDIFSGTWVYDDSFHPLYQPSSCSILEQSFRCQQNGRPDHSYTKWRWKPRGCNIPSFNGMFMLERLQDKRIVFVGDSMGRTQWESLVCMLMATVIDKSSVFEINNSSITKRTQYLAFHFSTHNVTVEYHRSPFLVQVAPSPKHAPKRVRSILKLDKLEASERQWRSADVLVFNSGHWWNPSKTHQMLGCYFYVADSLRLGLKVEAAYQRALRTWASWVESTVNTTKTRVVIRSFEPSHWDWQRKKCYTQKQPNVTTKWNPAKQFLLYNRILNRVVKGMNKTIELLNIAALTESRSDGHVGKWTGGDPPLDCSHWCLPGVPDTWNQLLYVTLFRKNSN